MRRFVAGAVLLFMLSFIGCGSGDLGPADPSDTPQVSEEEIRKSMEESMPDEAKKQYGL